MKTNVSVWLLGVALLLPAPVFGQTTAPSSIQRERPRSSFDPGAAAFERRQQTPGAVTTALGSINPCNENYGWAFDDAHIAAAQETFHNFLWWSLLWVTVCFALALAYILYQIYERELLLDMTSHMFAQLFNAHHVSWDRADKLTKEYNSLMRRFNTQTQELWAAQKLAAQLEEQKKKKAQGETTDKLTNKNGDNPKHLHGALNLTADQEGETTTVVSVEPDEQTRPSNTPPVVSVKPGETNELTELKTQVKQLEASAFAREQKITNLRKQLNQAHDRFVAEPQQGGGQ